MYSSDWSGWRGCCRHCHRGVSVCGPLNEQGFCRFCVKKGHDKLHVKLSDWRSAPAHARLAAYVEREFWKKARG
jgi:hypothetical protein